MLNSFPIAVLIGIFLGFLSGLGTGGGSLLILYLTAVLQIPQPQARAMNLLFFIPSALIASLFRGKQGHLPIKIVLSAVLAGSISAGLFAYFSGNWDISLLRKLFGILLLFTGIREIMYRPK